ncbi:MAG TPA: hypothetical protein VFR67_01775 [Pilimelia sp.]|nr:hypothetical protein [Pilimelia sp.]
MSTEPGAVRFAALAAPAVDRVFVAAMTACRTRGGAELGQRYGGPAATGFLVEFRTRLAAPGGAVTPAGFAAVTRYRDPDECKRALDKQIAHSMVARDAAGAIQATERGREYLREIYRLQGLVIGELWEAGHAARVGRLVEALERLLDAATADSRPDEAFAAMAPPYEPDGTPLGVVLLNRLGALRYHRADAHAAAWTAAGQTAQGVVAMPAGPARAAVEDETNRLAAPPYAVLTGEERLTFLADLAALPG